MNYFKSGLVLLFSGLVALGHGGAAAEAVATVRFVAGQVTASVASQPPRTLAKDDAIEHGGRIDTAANGRVQMRFTDGGLVSLMPDSSFSVDDYAYQEGADDGTLVFSLLRGGLRTMTGAIGKTRHEGYQLDTPVATLGIRGTQFTAVLSPPDTMRVHVGEGRVVITNSSGTLDVPAGRSAVVVLGSAPAFSEQAPAYRVTAPMGDRLVAVNTVTRDPLIGPPLTDQDVLRTIDDFESSQSPPSPPVVPPSGTVLPDGPGYAIAGALASPVSGVGLWQQSMQGSGLTAQFDSATGGLLSLGDFPSLPIVLPGEFQTAHVVTRGALSWGEFTDGAGTINGMALDLTDGGLYMPYVVGMRAQNVPLSGTLNYSLDGATPVRDMYGQPLAEAVLDQFDLGLNLDNATYTLDMQLNSSDLGIYRTNSSGGAWTGTVDGFRLDDTAVTNADGCSYGCRLEVEGFVAGPNATQAGVSYFLVDNDHAFMGAAGLKQ